MKKSRILSALVAAAAAGVLVSVPAYAKDMTIPDGIYVGEFNLGGMTEEEAEAQVKAYIDGLADQKITLNIEGQMVETSAKELGFYWSNTDAVDEAAAHAVGGNLIEQYMGRKDLQKNPVNIPLETAVNETSVETFVTEKCEGIAAEAQNATIVRENGQFVITPGITGKVVDIEATKDALDAAITEGAGEPVTVDAVVAVKEPDITEEDLSTISDVLGTCSTSFSSSGAARSKNLSNGAAKINGRVLMPGETLSGYECMQPFTTENGYYTAAAYENGQVVDSIGGGVCQIATTLYNAALRSELEITQRQNHSMIVTYVKPSMDAAIAGTYKDIKITNNYSTPIYVEGYTENRELYFTIYGKETRPANREVKYESETLGSTDPGAPTEKVDPSLAPGTRRQVQSAHRGLRSRLWKVVYVDGVEVERTLLHTDTYNASKAIVLVGPPAPVVAPVQPLETAPQPTDNQPSETQAAVVEGVDGGPGVTAPEPSPTQAPEPAPTQAPEAAPEAAPEPAPEPAPAPAPKPATEAPANPEA